MAKAMMSRTVGLILGGCVTPAIAAAVGRGLGKLAPGPSSS